MPQTFNVLQCHACKTFQVQQIKKVNKWTCKICNEKQSVIKIFGQGAAADCRKQVQSMNLLRKDKIDTELDTLLSPSSTDLENSSSLEVHDPVSPITKGRWDKYIEPTIDSESDQDNDIYTTSRSEFEQTRKKRKRERIHHVKLSVRDKPVIHNNYISDVSKIRALEQDGDVTITSVDSLQDIPDNNLSLSDAPLYYETEHRNKELPSKWTKFLSYQSYDSESD